MISHDQMADILLGYANQLKKRQSPEQQAIVEAILLAEEIKRQQMPSKALIAKLRGSAIQHRPASIFISTTMDLIADQLEGKEVVKQ